MDNEYTAYDLNAQQRDDWAVHLPALSGFYVHQMSKLDDNNDHHGVDRYNPRFEKGHYGLDFFNGSGYFNYRWGLYSAGHAELDLNKSKVKEHMVQNRSKDTVLIGDSGGFQIAKGVGHFKNIDWKTFKGPDGDKIRQTVLDWLEATADYSMTLDVPAHAAEPPLCDRTGLYTFKDTLDFSVYNLDYFIKHRTVGKTKFLNVLSGTTRLNSKVWYNEVKKYSDKDKVVEMGYTEGHTMEGYAFAGINMKHMPTTLHRLGDLIEDDLLKDKEWIHFLGVGRMDWACLLTIIQRQLREHYEEKITVSFDCASAFLAVAKGLMYVHPSFTPKRLGYFMKKAIDDRGLKHSTIPMPFGGPIADRMTLGDMCRLGPGEPNKTGKVAKTSWDNSSYLMGMASNVYIHLNSVQEALRLLDYELALNKNVHYLDWIPQKKNASAVEVSDFLPSNILFFQSFAEEFFDPARTYDDRLNMIKFNFKFLESLSIGGKKANNFNDIFDTESANMLKDEDLLERLATYKEIDDVAPDQEEVRSKAQQAGDSLFGD